MKLTSLFASLALVCGQAQDQAQDDAAPAAAHPQESYGAQESYGGGQESYGAEAPVYQGEGRRAAVCLGGCPRHARCQNKETGACLAASSGYEQPAYARSDVQTGDQYGQQSGRSLQMAQQQNFGGDVGEMTGIGGAPDGSCPPGFRDTHCDRLHNRTVLWIAFGLLFLPALYFFYMAFNDSTVNQGLQDPTSVAAMINGLGVGATAEEVVSFLDRVRAQRMVSGVICFIASLAYLTMALGYGFTVRCFDGRQFFYARYVDWAITTPLMLWEIMEHTAATDAQKYFLYAMDILMIVAGLIGSLVEGSDKWAFFGFSMLCFCPVIWFICSLRENIVDYYKNAYTQVVSITAITWVCYPVVWILAEGTDTICAQAEAICYTVLDIIAKSVFGYVLVNNAISFNVGKAVAPAGTSML